jgi:hypothetical protein
MRWILAGALLALIVLVPGLAAALLAVLGAVAMWAAAQPTVLAFALGALAWPRIAASVRRTFRSTR